MTDKPKMTPGCYSSAVFYRTDAPECISCPFRADCSEAVKAGEQVALKLISRFDVQFNTSKTAQVSAWWSNRWKPKTSKAKDVTRFNELLSRWTSVGINPFHLTHGRNPLADRPRGAMYEIFQFMIEVKAFKPKDIAEHMRELHPDIPKTKSLSQAKLVCDTLTHNEILKRDKKGVLCL